MKNIVVIQLKNLFRRVVYRFYLLHKKYIEPKISNYDLQTIDIIKQLPADAVCIDVGANEGQVLQYMYRQCHQGKIIAIEPIPYLANTLKKIYTSQRITIVTTALSDKKGEAVFFHAAKRPALSGLKAVRTENVGYEEFKVPLTTLDELLASEQRIDLIKIDVEGAEFNVLAGGREILARLHPVIILESGVGGMEHYDHKPEELFDFFSALGYKLITMEHYLNKRAAFTREVFVHNFTSGYDFQYVAY